MESLKEEFKSETIKILGKRLKDGVCSFCGKPISNGDFCECPDAQKVNRYYKKANRILNEYNNLIIIQSDLNEIRKRQNLNCNTPILFDGMNFDDYKIESESESNAKAAVLNYYNNSISNYLFGRNLVLIGGFGTGKTMLESILCHKLSEKWLFKCQFINAVDLKGEITKCFHSKSTKTVDEVVNRYKKADFLFLDDIDKLTPTEYVQEFIYSLVNYRVEHQLPIITSANHTLEELDSKFYGEAVVSRLINNSPVVSFTHKNRRFQ